MRSSVHCVYILYTVNAHSIPNGAGVEYSTCALLHLVVQSNLYYRNVDLDGVLSRKSGAQCTSIFVHHEGAKFTVLLLPVIGTYDV